MNDQALPQVFSVASVVINLPMKVPHLPLRGSTVMVSGIGTEVGGAYNVMSAIKRQGIDVVNYSLLGTGPNSMFARRVLRQEGITTASTEVVGDTGTKLVFVENDGHNTSIISPGVEAGLNRSDLEKMPIKANDFLYVSAGDLVIDAYRTVLCDFLSTLNVPLRLVMAISPLVDSLTMDMLRPFLPHVFMLTMNNREHDVLLRNLHLDNSQWGPLYEAGLPQSAKIVHRLGSGGVRFFDEDNVDGCFVSSFLAEVVDTTGVGDAHTGVIIAELVRGASFTDAVRRGNLAGSVVVQRHGSATCPTYDELQKIAKHVISL